MVNIEEAVPGTVGPGRRAAILAALGVTAVLAMPAPASGAVAAREDVATLNLLLNIEYLQAQFYAQAATGAGLGGELLGGTGQRGDATGGRRASLSDSLVAQFAAEAAGDQQAHVRLLRATLGADAVAQPRIDLGGGPDGAFTAMARAAGIVASGGTFDPYGGDGAFLLAAYFLEDLGVALYRRSAAQVRDPSLVDLVTGLLGTEVHHAAFVRATIHARGQADAPLLQGTDAISALRTRLNRPIESDKGVTPVATPTPAGAQGPPSVLVSNISVPLGGNGSVGRSGPETLNVLYLSPSAVSAGGFFPAGVNGEIRTGGQA